MHEWTQGEHEKRLTDEFEQCQLLGKNDTSKKAVDKLVEKSQNEVVAVLTRSISTGTSVGTVLLFLYRWKSAHTLNAVCLWVGTGGARIF
ncbi:MAG: hypothetical protein GY820_21700 [Gammaproteobacteria bacterium]|nr:hypothetical protein [Gammaproteobacteria bacterium]